MAMKTEYDRGSQTRGVMSLYEAEVRSQLVDAKEALAKALLAGVEAGYGSEFSGGLTEVLETLEAFRKRMEL
jgi:hypothetical protein